MNEVLVDNIAVLIKVLNELPNNFLYRGHADSAWQLRSSLERVIGDNWTAERARKFEDYSLKQFCSKFHLYDHENNLPSSKLAWLSVMQHYGVPTRLLDFTESPYVALYFALEAYSPQSLKDLALYAIDYAKILDQSIDLIRSKDAEFSESRTSIVDRQDEVFDNVVDRFSYEIVWVTEPKLLNSRLDKQAGSFLLSGDRGKRIEDVLALQRYADCSVTKYIIKRNLYEGLFALLRKMNITSKSLYGDLDGLARSIRMQMQVYAFDLSLAS